MSARVPLVLLHPFPLDARMWDPVRAEGVGDRAVLAPDAPGMGGAAPPARWTIADWADEVAGRMRAEMPGGRALVAGVSMGGYCALALAARHPDVLAGLVLADTRAEADDDATRAGRAASAEAVRREGPDAVLRALLPRLVAPGASPAVRATLAELAGRQSPEGLIGALGALAGRPDRRDVLPGIRVPTLVVVGEHDAPTPPAVARAMAEAIPGARLVVVRGAGHMTPLEDPATFARLLRRHAEGL